MTNLDLPVPVIRNNYFISFSFVSDENVMLNKTNYYENATFIEVFKDLKDNYDSGFCIKKVFDEIDNNNDTNVGDDIKDVLGNIKVGI